MSPRKVRVIAGIIIDGGRVLLTQRKGGVEYPRLWECPGGKVESVETDAQTLGRELSEELGVTCAVDASRSFATTEVVQSEQVVTVVHYLATIIAHARPQPLAADGIGWFDGDELRGLNVVPSLERMRGRLSCVLGGLWPLNASPLDERHNWAWLNESPISAFSR